MRKMDHMLPITWALAIALLLPLELLAYTECSNITRSETYQNQLRMDEFVVLYNTKGKHAPAELHDGNSNEIPDFVDDLLLQLVTMRQVLEQLGFRHPFESYRYERVGVSRIYVAIRDLDRNGTSYDPAHRDVSKGRDAPCVLLMAVANDLQTGNLTPAHELFHLYQYGYTVFKNAWYLEGMARWSEGLLETRNHASAPLPDTIDERSDLFSRSYGAVSFWIGVINMLSSSSAAIPSYAPHLSERRYSNGERVIDSEAGRRGSDAIIAVLETFDRLDREISIKTGRRLKSWSNRERKDPQNSDAMLQAVLTLIEKRKRISDN